MKHKIMFIFMVMLISVAILNKVQAQSLGEEQTQTTFYGLVDYGDGSYSLYMNGGSVTTNTNGSYNINGSYDANGNYVPPKGITCDGCSLIINTTYQQVEYQSPTNPGYQLSQQPPSIGTYSTTYMVAYNGNNEGAQFYLMNDGTYKYIPYGQSNTYTTTTSYTQGSPSCERQAAQQATTAQMTWDYENTIRTQSATQYAATQTFVQAQMDTAWQRLNASLYYYYYYSNYYTQQVRYGYSGSVASLTPPTPPLMDSIPPRTDTMQPIVVTDTSASRRGATLTALLGSVEPTASMKDLRANVNTRLFEVGFAINIVPGSNPPVYVDSFYNKTGTSQNVAISYNNWSAALVHSHIPKDTAGDIKVDGPSPQDMMVIIKAWADTSLYMKHRLIANYAISGDSLHYNEYAVAITDTAAARMFWATHPLSSVIDNGTNGNLNNWAGSEKDKNSLFKQFKDAYNRFKKAGYPIEYCEDYANVYMMQQLNMGIKFYREVNGVFKELNYNPITDKITISQ